MIVINVVIVGFGEEDLKWLADVTVRLQPTVRLRINKSKIQQFMHQSHLREL